MSEWIQPPDETRVRPRLGAWAVGIQAHNETRGDLPEWEGVHWPPQDSAVTENSSETFSTAYFGPSEDIFNGGSMSASTSGSDKVFINSSTWAADVWRLELEGPPNLTPSRPAGVPARARIEWENPAGEVVANYLQLQPEVRNGRGDLEVVDGADLGTVRFYVLPKSWAPNHPEPPYADIIRRSDLEAWTYTQLLPGVRSDRIPLYGDDDPLMLLVPEEMVNATGAIDYTPPGNTSFRASWSIGSSIRSPVLTYTYRPPRYRILTHGAWRTRQRQSLTGADSWPLRQRQDGGHTGSWAVRQRQTGV